MLKVAVTDPDNPDYPVIPDLLPQAASSRCQDPGLAPRNTS